MEKRPFYMVIIGPSGGGKGTQADLLEEKFGWRHLSVGHLIRVEVRRGTALGKSLEKKIKKGEWVPTSQVKEILLPVLRRSLKRGFILDGFPRTKDQALVLDEFLSQNKIDLDLAVHLKLREEVIIARRKKAWEKGKSFYPGEEREDETPAAIRTRLRFYRKTIKPILAFYRKKGILAEVDGEKSIREIYQQILNLIRKKIEEKKR